MKPISFNNLKKDNPCLQSRAIKSLSIKSHQSEEKTSQHYTALLWQKEASDKSDISCKRAKCVYHFPLTSMEYHDVLPNISLSRSIDA